jgi:hypothetical protein
MPYFFHWLGYLEKKLIHSLGYKQKTILKNQVPQSKTEKEMEEIFIF